jgi:TPR repeat protein
MRMLGVMNEKGEGGPQDLGQARRWYEQARIGLERLSAAGSRFAMWQLAIMHESGQGVPRDPAKAAYWRQQAASARAR